MRSARPRRGRHARKQNLKAPSTQSLVSRNVIETLEDRTLLTAFTVVNTNDSGAGSLRDAIAQANLNAGEDTITFDASLASQTIVLSDEILISDDVTILGLGADQLTLDGNGNSRIFNIDDGDSETRITVEMSGLTLTNGFADSGGAIRNYENLTITDSTISENQAAMNIDYGGGGIYSAAGSLTVMGSLFTGNSAFNGGGIYALETLLTVSGSTFSKNSADRGGGINFDAPYSDYTFTANVTNSTFSENVTDGNGAGILFDFGQAFVDHCTFTGNISDRSGGGIGNLWTELTVQNSSFDHNYARLYGAGIANGSFFYFECGGDLLILNCTLSENQAANNGGGFFTNCGNVDIVNTTISGNSAKTSGAIYTRHEGPATLVITNSTITGNSATYIGGISGTWVPVTIMNSIVAGNPTEDGKPQNTVGRGAVNSIIQDSIEGLLDPVLRDNGGPVKTHALLTGSAAIDAGDNTAVSAAGLDFDQRGDGFDRIVGGTVDIGAYESQVNHTQVDLRIVSSKTSTGLNGEVSALPQSRDWLDEWSGYWLEIWVGTPAPSDHGIQSVVIDFSYNTDITTATSIEYGAAFTENQTGSINDQTGQVVNLSADTSLSGVGDDEPVLFARIYFESTEVDSINLDWDGQSLNPQSVAVTIEDLEILDTADVVRDDPLILLPQTQIYANPFDLNDDDIINYRDLIQLVTVYGVAPSESVSGSAWFVDYDQNDLVNYRDLIQLIGNYGKSKANAIPVNYPAYFPYAWNQLLTVEAQQPPQIDAKSVTQADAESVLEVVVEQVSPQLTSDQRETLETVNIEVIDLSAGTLGRAVPGTIYIDVNAAGYGWFVDATPTDNSEFSFSSELSLIALPDSEAAGHVDLWTVILHELAHLLGYEHADDGAMQASLIPGERRLLDWEDSDQFFADFAADGELTAF
ncbi:choice-of-anchor Q domain-containing protein [Gimesia sp.]|uniref:choice-of-anchor Q domain-containing protein n=1 Tax=Gimesia sp. TaxID=2024833 RepID=UPI003A913620